MGLSKQLVVAIVILTFILLAPANQSIHAQDDVNYLRFTSFPAGNVCNFPGGIFPYAVTGVPMYVEANIDPENLIYVYVSGPGLWRRNYFVDTDGAYGESAFTIPGFLSYSLGATDTLLIEVEVYPEYEVSYNPYSPYGQLYPSGDLVYYQYIVVECATGDIIDSGETFYN